MREAIKLGLVLMLITGIAGLALGFVYVNTKNLIKKNDMAKEMAALEKLVGHQFDPAKYEIASNITLTNAKIYAVYKLGNDYVIKFSGNGFGGEVLAVGKFAILNKNVVELQKFEVLDASQETPGLGEKITEPDVIKRFEGVEMKKGGEVLVNKDAGVFAETQQGINQNKKKGIVQTSDVMTGATITPRGVSAAITAVINWILEKEER
jgi:electron transport complex protein RnfG